MGPTLGQKTPEQPDEIDGGGVVEGVGVDGLATGPSSAAGCLVVCGSELTI